jgi:hypothetical protein
MRLLALALIFTGSGMIAQSPTGFGRLIYPSGLPPNQQFGAGFGRLIYPGTGGPPAVRRPGVVGPRSNVALPAVSHPYHGGAVIVPYPVFYGGYYNSYDAPQAPVQGDGYDYGYAAQQPSPVVVLNQNFAPDGGPAGPGAYPPGPYLNAPPPDQSQTAASPDTSQQVLFFIAMKDHTIFPAVAYWVDGDTLNYITNQGVRNRVSLDLVDVDFSKQLNQQRGVDFALPGVK